MPKRRTFIHTLCIISIAATINSIPQVVYASDELSISEQSEASVECTGIDSSENEGIEKGASFHIPWLFTTCEEPSFTANRIV